MQFIDLKKQYQLIEEPIHKGIQAVLAHGQYIMGPEIEKFEGQISQYTGSRHVISCASGTDALLMALMALDIKPGDEIITSPFSFFATAEVIALCQAVPVFVDIDPITYNLDPQYLKDAITSKTKAIIPVGLYGQCAEMDEINRIAEENGLAVIEDAAQSFGASYRGKKSCALSTIGCTSFFPSKPLGAYGDAGACFTDSDVLAQRLREVRVHGQNQRYKHAVIGINGRMDTIQAAVLIEKLKLFPKEVELRQTVADRYARLLSGVSPSPFIKDYNRSIYAQYTTEVDSREFVQKIMQEQGVPTAVHYPIPMHLQEALSYLGYKRGDFPHAEKASERVLSLPMHPYLTLSEQETIVAALKSAINQIEVADVA